MTDVIGYAAMEAGAELQPVNYQFGALGADEVHIRVETCGICHSDLSMLDNQWGLSQYPLVAGHEVVGRIDALGSQVSHLKIGQRVGLGWYAGSCSTCRQCVAGDHHLCDSSEQTIVKRAGGFANYVRCKSVWAIPLPESLDPATSGPLFCGGITVFNPLYISGVKATDRVGVIGIGGLGHLAVQFLNKWGCHVTAFTTSPDKKNEIIHLGAHQVVETTDVDAIKSLTRSFDFLLVTVNVTLNWAQLLDTLAPNGRLHVVGAVLEPMAIPAFSLIGGQKSLAGSPLGSPATTALMLDFCQRHDIAPLIESYPMSDVNRALDRLRSGKARYRVVLTAD